MEDGDARRESDYRLLSAVMALLAGGEEARGDPNVMVTVGLENRELVQTEILLEMLAKGDKGCIYVEAPKPWGRTRPPLVHVLLPTGIPGTRFDVTGRCSFWTANATDRLLITSPKGERGHFEMVDGRMLHHAGPPPGSIAGGIARAGSRLRAAMHAMRNVADEVERLPSRTARTVGDLRSAFDDLRSRRGD